MLGSPAAAVGYSRMVSLPALSGTVSVLVVHAVHVPVDSNETVAAVEPLRIRSAGRAVPLVWPLANRIPSLAVPGVGAFTVNWAYAPAAALPLHNPLPEKPA